MSAEAPARAILPVADGRATTRLVWTLLRPHRGALGAAVAAFLVAGLTALVPPWVLGLVVDEVEAGDGSTVDVVRLGLVIAGAAVVGAVAAALSLSFLARAAEPALASLREDVLARTLRLPTGRLEEAGAGDLLSRVGDDVRTVATAMKDVVPLVIGSLVAVVFTAAGLFALDWRLGLAGLAAAPSYVLALRWYLPRSGPLYREERVAQGERAQAMVSGLQGAPSVRAFAREEAHLAEVDTRSRRTMGIAITVFGMLCRFGSRTNRSELIGLAVVLATGFWLVRADAVTVGAVTTAALYFHRLFNPIGALMFLFDEVQSTGASLARLAGVATMPSPAPAPPAALPAQPAVVLRGLGHEYVAGTPALRDVDLELSPGERVAVVGATGAGKTTLGQVVAGVLAPTTGTATLGGAAYDDLGERAVRDHVVLVSQDVHVFSGTVRDAVTLARPDASDDAVRRSLERVHAWRWVAALPDGLDTVVGGDGHPLTPAQAQQLALARVDLRDPAVVVLDEATAEAGSAGARELEAAAHAVTEGRTALVVAHRLTQSERADRVVVMADGRIVEHGTHAELLTRPGPYADLWAAWSAR
ncbi:ABC transporter ATP-binding protein [Nocardioides marmoraquaticus]